MALKIAWHPNAAREYRELAGTDIAAWTLPHLVILGSAGVLTGDGVGVAAGGLYAPVAAVAQWRPTCCGWGRCAGWRRWSEW